MKYFVNFHTFFKEILKENLKVFETYTTKLLRLLMLHSFRKKASILLGVSQASPIRPSLKSTFEGEEEYVLVETARKTSTRSEICLSTTAFTTRPKGTDRGSNTDRFGEKSENSLRDIAWSLKLIDIKHVHYILLTICIHSLHIVFLMMACSAALMAIATCRW